MSIELYYCFTNVCWQVGRRKEVKRKDYKDSKCKDTGTKRGETRRGRKAATRRESAKGGKKVDTEKLV